MHLRRIAFVPFLMLAMTAVDLPIMAHPPTIVNEAGERAIGEEIQAFRKSMAEAIRSKDATKLREMYAAHFSYTDWEGVTHAREAHLAAALAGQPTIETAVVRDLVIRTPNDWVAVVTGNSVMETGRTGPGQIVKWLAVYTRAGKSWVLVAQHATRNSARER